MGLFRRNQRHELALTLTLDLPVPPARPSTLQPSAGPTRLVITTDLLLAAWRQLFPAERMVVFGGRRTAGGIRVTSVFDVTEANPTRVHVRACPSKLATSLVDLDRTGTHLCAWMHSHPGSGPGATYPSPTDLNQDADLRRDYSKALLGIIATHDGWLRLFGEAVRQHAIEVAWRGKGIEEFLHDPYAFRIKLG